MAQGSVMGTVGWLGVAGDAQVQAQVVSPGRAVGCECSLRG